MQNEREAGFAPSSSNPGGTGDSRSGQTFGMGADHLTDFTTPTADTSDGIGSRAKEIASDVGHEAADRIEARAETQKTRAADSLGSVAQSLRTASAQLHDQEGVSRYMERAATNIDNLSAFLANRDMAELVDEVEGFARRQPAAFVGGAFALGMLGARFLKSSRHNLDDDDRMRDSRAEDLTYRLNDAGRDGISRPSAPGYVPSAGRSDTDFRAPGSF